MAKNEEKNVDSALSDLPWRVRMRIKSGALWDICPTSVQGAIIWTMLSPCVMLALAVLTRLDPVGNYPLRWGHAYTFAIMWLPAVLMSAVFLPAANGVVALRWGGAWPEYMAAIRGAVPPSGGKPGVSFSAWALFIWLWIVSVFLSWLEDRGLREAGVTLGGPVSWHVFNAARIEMCAWIFLTLAFAWLSRAKVFEPQAGEGVLHRSMPRPRWRRLRDDVHGLRRAAREALLESMAGPRSAWTDGRRKKLGLVRSAVAAWVLAPFAVRIFGMSVMATFSWFTIGWSSAQVWDAEWARMTVGSMSVAKFVSIAALTAMMLSLATRQRHSKVGSALWFGPSGPKLLSWAWLVGAALASDRFLAFKMGSEPLCVNMRLAGGGVLLVSIVWVAVVWGGEVMGWAGAFLLAWNERARNRGPLGMEAYMKVAWDALRASWRAAGQARAQLGEAVEKKAMQNEQGLALAQRDELEEAVVVAPKRSRGPNRL